MFIDIIYTIICEYINDDTHCRYFLRSFKVPPENYEFVFKKYSENDINFLDEKTIARIRNLDQIMSINIFKKHNFKNLKCLSFCSLQIPYSNTSQKSSLFFILG